EFGEVVICVVRTLDAHAVAYRRGRAGRTLEIELARGDVLAELAVARPPEARERVRRVVVELDLEIVFLAGDQIDRAGIFGRAVIGPVVDQWFAVDPETNAVVGRRVESIGAGISRLYLTRPSHREMIGRDAHVGHARSPVE